MTTMTADALASGRSPSTGYGLSGCHAICITDPGGMNPPRWEDNEKYWKHMNYSIDIIVHCKSMIVHNMFSPLPVPPRISKTSGVVN